MSSAVGSDDGVAISAREVNQGVARLKSLAAQRNLTEAERLQAKRLMALKKRMKVEQEHRKAPRSASRKESRNVSRAVSRTGSNNSSTSAFGGSATSRLASQPSSPRRALQKKELQVPLAEADEIFYREVDR
jgi:hypothetical protein